jgi:hypothetical protein
MVEVLAVIDGRDAINSVLTGSQDAMSQPESLAWVCARVAGASGLEDVIGGRRGPCLVSSGYALGSGTSRM